jgi:hypothetical protein
MLIADFATLDITYDRPKKIFRMPDSRTIVERTPASRITVESVPAPRTIVKRSSSC